MDYQTLRKTHPFRKLPVLNCARCGTNHRALNFKPMKQPVVDNDGTSWGWWALCPNTGDPILMRDIDMRRQVYEAEHEVEQNKD